MKHKNTSLFLKLAAWRHLLIAMLLLSLFGSDVASAASRIKDLSVFEGIRENQLIGYGLVVGLNGSGDTLNNAPFTRQSLQAMLERLGVNTRGLNLRTANVAAVMVTANLPPFATQGTRIDITVSALGDAKSLQGGTLLVTPLLGADGEVYAVGQGAIATNGFAAQGNGASVTQNIPTVGRISNGAIVEKEIGYDLASVPQIKLALRNPDLTTSKRIAGSVNDFLGLDVAKATDPGTVLLEVPDSYRSNIVSLLTDIEQLRIDPDQSARVVIDEKSGIIVMGEDVRVSKVAIAQGNLTVTIAETPEVSQPNPLAEGETTIVPRTEINVTETSTNQIAVVEDGVTLYELVNGLNALGLGPRDLISILQAIKTAGALHADIEVM